MDLNLASQDSRPDKALQDDAFFRQGLARNWGLRYGRRTGSLSRLSSITDGAALLLGGALIAASLYWPAHFPHQTAIVVLVAAAIVLVASHGLNRTFRSLESRAFLEIEHELAGERTIRASSTSLLFLLAKLAIAPRVRAKHAWVEKRMQQFVSRRAVKERQAEIFEKNCVKLGSIHGSTRDERTFERGVQGASFAPAP